MNVLQYNDLHPGRLQCQFEQTVEQLKAGQFHAAEVKKLAGAPFYRAKLSDADRLLFKIGMFKGETQILLLEIITNHAYEKSRFLNGAKIDENKLTPVPDPKTLASADLEQLPYINTKNPRFHVLDKIISFDEFQYEAFNRSAPLILIGSAGSGKTVLTLEKIKLLTGDVLYVTLSPYLTEHARNLYYAHNYENDHQNLDFLSFRELIESLRVPVNRPITFRAFSGWYGRHRHSYPVKDAHMLYEEFNGVLTGSTIDRPFLSRADYMALGVRQSIFAADLRPLVYGIFEKYRCWMAEDGWYDLNMTAHAYLRLVQPAYDFVVVDEVQDFTNIQVHLILKSLRRPEQFILCGDANQVVHPNFFSWANVKTMFYERRIGGHSEILRVLNSNFRNSPQVTDIANRLLLIKNARFGSIDRESNYLVRCASQNTGAVEFLCDDEKIRRDLNAKTARSTRFAVIVLREDDKPDARRLFQTPLLFSIQEAKGLEYENIILLGFVSACRMEFNKITEGVAGKDLDRDLNYARARDKTDKSLEAFKFFINALYVGVTRAVRTLYWIEHDTNHRLFNLLELRVMGQAEQVKNDVSSMDEWREEARKLELQGKQEQAEAIHQTILGIQAVPWKIITPDTLEELKKEALNPDRFNKQAKLLLYEYAIIHAVPYLFKKLVDLKFNRAADPEQDRSAVEGKYALDYQEKSFNALKHKINLHGVDFRNPLNQTPLMIAAKLGMTELVSWLIKEGANPELRDNWGRIPLQIALRQAFLDPVYARDRLGAMYAGLAPTCIRGKIENRLIKIDERKMEFFLLHSMLALFQEILRVKIKHRVPGFETGDFIKALEHFPEPVISLKRRRREYISSVLARNEVFRVCPYNHKLFVRISHGFYLPNPCLEIEIDERWVNIYDLLRRDFLAREKSNKKLQYLLGIIKDIRKNIERAANQPPLLVVNEKPVAASSNDGLQLTQENRSMTSREIIKRNLSSGGASRFGMIFSGDRCNDFTTGDLAPSAVWTKKSWSEGNTEFYTDEWGNTWHRLVGMSAGGEIFKPALENWSQLKDWKLPDMDDPARYVPVKETFDRAPDQYHLAGLPGFPFAVSRYLRKMEIYFQDLVLEREHIDELHDKVTGLLERMIRQYAAAGADGVFFCEDWGIQDRLLISPDMWREIFKPLYRRLCATAHKAGLQVLMHSCGYNWAILDDLGEVGVNAFQFDQPTVYGLERLAGKLKTIGVCLWSPVDIQKIMPTGNKKLIEESAKQMVELFFNQNGQFIAKNYGDLKGIGVKEEWDKWAYELFVKLAGINL